MYLISQIHKKGVNGGRYICQVYKVSDLDKRPARVTSSIAKKYNLKIDKGDIIIYFGCGTGVMVISQLIKEDSGEIASDVSV